MASATRLTGGCQCGAVRFRAERLGRASICHCRMCQKAFGAFFGPLVTAYGVVWTRGAPSHFQSSNVVRRGFCERCGTPLTYEYDGGTELAIGAFDDPRVAAPSIQVNPADLLPFVDGLSRLPFRGAGDEPEAENFLRGVVSHQHPDHDTAVWPPEGARHD
ncbi:MAG TPA: GFA family protein [Bauldia sp.]|nr:GFA family protein [Bauldia sp.]